MSKEPVYWTPITDEIREALVEIAAYCGGIWPLSLAIGRKNTAEFYNIVEGKQKFVSDLVLDRYMTAGEDPATYHIRNFTWYEKTRLKIGKDKWYKPKFQTIYVPVDIWNGPASRIEGECLSS